MARIKGWESNWDDGWRNKKKKIRLQIETKRKLGKLVRKTKRGGGLYTTKISSHTLEKSKPGKKTQVIGRFKTKAEARKRAIKIMRKK